MNTRKYIFMSDGAVMLCADSDRLPTDDDLPVSVCYSLRDDDDCYTFKSPCRYKQMSGIEEDVEYVAMNVLLPGINKQIDFKSFNVEEYGLRPVELRRSYTMLSAEEYGAAAKGAELLYWSQGMRFCPRCGERLHRNGPISKRCPKCGVEQFPQMTPAIIVLVRRGEEALLVHARNFKRHFFGLVAGFVETGESLEECVAREVMEETSLKIKNIQYFGSQSWPFPSQLMIGFTADYESGELCFADNELSEGGFFRRDNLPELPTPPSIARRMIEAWLE